MKPAAILLCFALALIAWAPAQAGYYRYQGSDGTWYYTDDPGTIPKDLAGDYEFVKQAGDDDALPPDGEAPDGNLPAENAAVPRGSSPPPLTNPYADGRSAADDQARAQAARASRRQARLQEVNSQLSKLYSQEKKLNQEKVELDEKQKEVDTLAVRKHQTRAGRRYRYERNELEKAKADYEKKRASIDSEIRKLEAEKAGLQ